jgi:hypothetical protein
MLHAYCIMPAGVSPAIAGIDNAQVRAIDHAGIAMWVSEHTAAPPATIESIKTHNEVVTAAMSTATPVPLRFGQALRDDADAEKALRTSHEKWAALLEKFEGAVEFGIRVFDPARDSTVDAPSVDATGVDATDVAATDVAAPATRGRQYMAELARRIGGSDSARRDLVNAMRREVARHVIEERMEALRTAHGVASVAHLVHRANADAYREGIEAVRLLVPGLRLLSTGPWPPYSFVE